MLNLYPISISNSSLYAPRRTQPIQNNNNDTNSNDILIHPLHNHSDVQQACSRRPPREVAGSSLLMTRLRLQTCWTSLPANACVKREMETHACASRSTAAR